MTGFATNNNDFLSIKFSPFFILRGLYPHMSFYIIDISDTITCKRINIKKL